MREVTMKLTDPDIESIVRSVYARLRDTCSPWVLPVFGESDWAPYLGVWAPCEAALEGHIKDFKLMAEKTRPLCRGERAIVSITKPKAAALLADRYWAPFSDSGHDITFGWEHPTEVMMWAFESLRPYFKGDKKATEQTPSEAESETFLADVERDLANYYRERTGADVVPLYASVSRRDAQYRSGDQSAIVAVIQNLGIADDEQLQWEQVMEFRQDKDARAAYRHFVHWLDKEMVDRPVSYIADELAARVERYEWALRKHGIETVVGVLSSTINPKYLLGTSGVAVALEVIRGKPIWSLLAAGGLLVGRATVGIRWASRSRISRAACWVFARYLGPSNCR
jgi:hypothetical protein